MSIEQDAASDGKKTLVLIIGVVIVLAAITYLGYGWFNQSDVSDSQYNLNRVANNAPVTSQESHQYRALLRLSNQKGAEEAETDGNSFVASLSESQLQDDPPISAKLTAKPVALKTQADTSAQNANTGAQGGLNDEQKQQVNNLLKQLSDRWKPVDMQLASSFSGNGEEQDGQMQSAFTQWAQSVPGLMPQQTAALSATETAAVVPARIQIPALSRYPSTIDTAVNSDSSSSPVLAKIPAGKLAGAMLAAKSVQLAGDGVVINFKTLEYAGMTCNVDAYALDDETQRSSVASNVNHRYVTRILLPALANGIGKVGQLYEDSNTQILSTNSGTITGRTGSPDGKAVAGVIAGGIGQQTAQVMTQDSSRLPITQVNVDRRQVVSILFMKAVTDKDCTPISAGEPR
ncbi:conjugal transfer protein TraO [Photorhabdus sp. RM71S]|uniref:conjugal transfer protein TraO n=1 Tax=Photorhabdus sp. RM71S TaxID=3342824 RepID=UPI0036D934ED